MHYVKQFNINGVDTRQVACIELQGKPNAATEGALGVLGIDMTSPLHDVYKCVAVNGSIYTWELLSSGTCVMSSIMTGAGEELVEFPYDKLKTVANYIVKVGDVIIDKEGYLYQVESLKNTSCMAGYNGTQIVSGMPKVGEVDNGKILSVVDGCHAFVEVEGSSVGQYVDESVAGLAGEVDNTYAKTADLKNGTITVKKATQDADGYNISSYYAKKSQLTGGTITVKKATQDASGNVIEETYAKTTDLTGGTTVVAKATNANEANYLSLTYSSAKTYIQNVSTSGTSVTLTKDRVYIITAKIGSDSTTRENFVLMNPYQADHWMTAVPNTIYSTPSKSGCYCKFSGSDRTGTLTFYESSNTAVKAEYVVIREI